MLLPARVYPPAAFAARPPFTDLDSFLSVRQSPFPFRLSIFFCPDPAQDPHHSSSVPAAPVAEPLLHPNGPHCRATSPLQVRIVAQVLGSRPNHELVDSSRAIVAAAEAGDSRIPEGDVEPCRAVVRLKEAHDAYEALLLEVEVRPLEMVYPSAMEGTDVDEEAAEGEKDDRPAAGAEGGDAPVQEEVVAVLKQAKEGKPVESVRLVDCQLRQLPEASWRIQGRALKLK